MSRRLLAEFLGSGLLATVVIGSGIMAQTLSPSDRGLDLLENAAATAVGLFVLILVFGEISGAHFNPVISFVDAAFGGTRWRDALAYVPAQVAGCIGGAVLANVMFALPAVTISSHHRATGPHVVSEVVATAGLVMVIFALARTKRLALVPAAVGAYIGGAYFFTSSTSFANPAIAVGRMFSNTFAGIAPSSVPAFVLAEAAGGAVGFVIVAYLYAHPAAARISTAVAPSERSVATSTDPSSPAEDRARPSIVFLCVHNAGRSQMAAAFARDLGGDDVTVWSAGSTPADQLNPTVVVAMAERGLDITAATPTRLSEDVGRTADVIVTMGCGDECPFYPGVRYLDWELPDPAGQPLEVVRPIRDDIEHRVRHLVAELLDRPVSALRSTESPDATRAPAP